MYLTLLLADTFYIIRTRNKNTCCSQPWRMGERVIQESVNNFMKLENIHLVLKSSQLLSLIISLTLFFLFLITLLALHILWAPHPYLPRGNYGQYTLSPPLPRAGGGLHWRQDQTGYYFGWVLSTRFQRAQRQNRKDQGGRVWTEKSRSYPRSHLYVM